MRRSSARALRTLAALVVLALVQLGQLAAVHAGPAAKRVIVFVGMPGSGKSFAAKRLAARYGVKHISTGDEIHRIVALRKAAGGDDPLVRQANDADPEVAARGEAALDRAVALEFSARPGELARKAADAVLADPSPISIVEGFRSLTDVDAFLAKVPQALIVAIEIGTARRHSRQLARGRAGEDNVAFLRDRDRSEVMRGQRDVMRLADVRIRPRGDASLDRSLTRVDRAAAAKASRAAD